ncbi:Predicted signal transduction protein [hydrothermal vent metagenome]|uniref:Predicted signal transduction protein n=1 Tax=hydrothermal vent metagenome TaxID=652676 RepID=A0A3B0Y0R3_9ZZZZ
MNEQAQQVLQHLYKALETDQIKLPTLPEVALNVRQSIEKGEHCAADIAELLVQDTSLSARLLQLANSPLYRARSEIDNLQMAITRLGIRIVKDLVIMLAIKQAFNTHNKAVEAQFRKVWQISIDIAAACRVLANTQSKVNPERINPKLINPELINPEINPEQAMLAGLIHNIGALPVIELTNSQPSLFDGGENLADICNEIQGPLGEKILRFWNFPQTLIDVVGQWRDFHRPHNAPVDYVDIVQAALLYTSHTTTELITDRSDIPAISKLGLDPSEQQFNDLMQQQFDETRNSLLNV